MIATLQGWMPGSPMHGGWIDGWFGWLWMIFWAAFLVLLAVGLVALIRYFWTKAGPSGTSESALDILKKRYARGELTREEFQRAREDLQ